MSKETLDFVPPLPPKNYKISSAFSYNFISALTRAIKQAISEIGVLNAGKKRDEVLELVGPHFARLEQHLGQMQKYQATIDYLTQENKGLRKQVNSEKSIQKQMEVLMLKKENEQLRRFVNSIPPEIRQALREQQRGQRHPKDYQR